MHMNLWCKGNTRDFEITEITNVMMKFSLAPGSIPGRFDNRCDSIYARIAQSVEHVSNTSKRERARCHKFDPCYEQ